MCSDAGHERLPLYMYVQISRLLRLLDGEHWNALLVGKIDPVLVFVWIAYGTRTLVVLGSGTPFAHVTFEIRNWNRGVV